MVEKPRKENLKPKPWVRTSKSKAVVAIDGWGNETIYPSGREAARQLGLNQSGVTYILAGKRKTTGGYTFRYVENE